MDMCEAKLGGYGNGGWKKNQEVKKELIF